VERCAEMKGDSGVPARCGRPPCSLTAPGRGVRRLWLSLAAVALCLFAAGKTRAGEAAGVLKVGGTGSGLGTLALLGEAFKASHPGIDIVIVRGLGGEGGIKAVLAGSIGLSVNPRPLSAAQRSKGATATAYAETPFVLATSRSNPVSGLTTGQLVDIYASKVKTWPDGSRIRLVTRPAGDIDTEILESISPQMKAAVEASLSREGMIFAATDQDAADLLEQVAGALGTTTVALIRSEKRALKALALDGVEPTPDALLAGTYPYRRVFYLVTGPDASALAREFVSFIQSAEGRAILLRTGHLVLPYEGSGKR
jgi:phosphate transport system substrate-binding protein